MKSRLNVILCAFLGLIALSGCRVGQIKANKTAEEGKSVVTFSISDSIGKTALPTVKWTDYNYVLEGKKDGESDYSRITESKVSYSGLTQDEYVLDAANYSFKVTAYSGATPLLSGVVNDVNLATGNKAVSFRMVPLKGLQGNASVTVIFPSTSDANITKIDVYYGTGFETTFQNGTSKQSFVTENFQSTASANKSKVTYSLNNLPSGVTQFAFFDLYSDKLKVASFAESLVVVGGQTSESVKEFTVNDLFKYTASIQLKKNGSAWADSYMTIVLKDPASGETYSLSDGGNGLYSGSIAEGTFDVYIKEYGKDKLSNTGTTFNSEQGQIDLNFQKVTLPLTGGVSVVSVKDPVTNEFAGFIQTEKEAENEYYVAAGSKGLFVQASIKPGYNYVDAGYVEVQNAKHANNATFYLPSNSGVVSTGGVTPIRYTITYDFADKGTELKGKGAFVSGYTAPSNYTVENYSTIVLPGAEKVKRDGYIFDGWERVTADGVEAFSRIPDGTHENLVVYPVWKLGATIETDPEELEEEEQELGIQGNVFASGFSLIIKWSDTVPGKTEVWYDYNSNGRLDTDSVSGETDRLVADIDFTNFRLRAENPDGSKPASDFTFTVLGGQLASLEGLGSRYSNRSTVNISGENTVIGIFDEDNKDNAAGIMLDSFTNECVNINGQMSGDYNLILVSPNKFVKGQALHKVAYIDNSAYAQLDKFTCLYKETSGNYEPQSISMMKDGSSATRRVIYLNNTEGASLPSIEDVLWLVDASGNVSQVSFTLGDSASVNIKGSVFSISVENGSFRLQQSSLAIKDAHNDTPQTLFIASSKQNASNKKQFLLTYEKSSGGGYEYIDEKKLDDTKKPITEADILSHKYKYMHVFSESDSLDERVATELLQTIIFEKVAENEDIKINVNLETVPYEEIAKYAGTHSDGSAKFSYYDGSFYMNVKKACVDTTINSGYDYTTSNAAKTAGEAFVRDNINEEYIKSITNTWNDAYNDAKATVFNGLNGYLMTIESDVENSYIYDRMNAQKAWTGGARLKWSDGVNTDILDAPSLAGLTYDKDETRVTQFRWMCGPSAGTVVYNGPKYNSTGAGVPVGVFSNFGSNEPNSSDATNGGEQCIQFHTSGAWNDMNVNGGYAYKGTVSTGYSSRKYRYSISVLTANSDYVPQSYIIEFTPYGGKNGNAKRLQFSSIYGTKPTGGSN